MNKRDIIVVAILVNCALLTVLFFTASVHNEELIPIAKEENLPTPASILVPENSATEEVIVKKDEEPIVHILPSIVEQKMKKEENNTNPSYKADSRKQNEEEKIQKVIVKAGDTLEKIAKANNASIQEIVAINNLPSSFLRVGQVLRIPGKKELLSKKTLKQELSKKDIEKKEKENAMYYVVRSGDNPWTIAMKHHIKVEELLRLNGLDEKKARKLKPGDKLRIK